LLSTIFPPRAIVVQPPARGDPNRNPNDLGMFQAYPSGAIVYTDGQLYIATYP
jgi:hypothetical protein